MRITLAFVLLSIPSVICGCKSSKDAIARYDETCERAAAMMKVIEDKEKAKTRDVLR
jgi:hypothetical protein